MPFGQVARARGARGGALYRHAALGGGRVGRSAPADAGHRRRPELARHDPQHPVRLAAGTADARLPVPGRRARAARAGSRAARADPRERLDLRRRPHDRVRDSHRALERRRAVRRARRRLHGRSAAQPAHLGARYVGGRADRLGRGAAPRPADRASEEAVRAVRVVVPEPGRERPVRDPAAPRRGGVRLARPQLARRPSRRTGAVSARDVAARRAAGVRAQSLRVAAGAQRERGGADPARRADAAGARAGRTARRGAADRPADRRRARPPAHRRDDDQSGRLPAVQRPPPGAGRCARAARAGRRDRPRSAGAHRLPQRARAERRRAVRSGVRGARRLPRVRSGRARRACWHRCTSRSISPSRATGARARAPRCRSPTTCAAPA